MGTFRTATLSPRKASKNIRVFQIIGVCLILACLGIALIYGNSLRTMISLNQVNDYPFYTMNYYGDYGFDDFLKVGATNDQELESYLMKRLMLGGLASNGTTPSFACSAFSARNATGEIIFGRNFDFHYTPIMLLRTNPPNGYASVAMADLSWLGFNKDNLPDPLLNRYRLLAAPYVPVDGINEKGLGVAFLAVPFAEPGNQPGRPTLNTTIAIRLMLDKAATVTEAIELLGQYNIYFSMDVDCHYFICDASGDAAVVEYVGGEIKVTRSEQPWHAVTNFILADETRPGDGHDRYQKMVDVLSEAKGVVSQEAAMGLLESVNLGDYTLWSNTYNLTTGEFNVAIGTRYDQIENYTFPLGRR